MKATLLLGVVAALVTTALSIHLFALPVGMKMVNIRRGVKTIVSTRLPGNPEIVEANVTSFKRKGRLVYGYKKSYLYVDGHKSVEGFFVLDTDSTQVTDGLSEADMLARVQSGK